MSNDQKKTVATPRKYDEAFKQEAVRLWQSSGQAAEHTARQLGKLLVALRQVRATVSKDGQRQAISYPKNSIMA
jgi:transposase-like protein